MRIGHLALRVTPSIRIGRETMVEFLRTASDFIARRKGLPVLIGVGLVLLNLLISLLPAWSVIAWLARTDLLLQLGVIVGLLGILIGDAV